MKKIYFLSLVFTIGFCLALGSCRSGNRKKQNPVATQTDRSNIRMHKASGWNTRKLPTPSYQRSSKRNRFGIYLRPKTARHTS